MGSAIHRLAAGGGFDRLFHKGESLRSYAPTTKRAANQVSTVRKTAAEETAFPAGRRDTTCTMQRPYGDRRKFAVPRPASTQLQIHYMAIVDI